MAREKDREKERDKEKVNRKVSEGSSIGSRAVSPMLDRSLMPSRAGHDSGAHDIWIRESKATIEGTDRIYAPERPFFANTTFYTLVRLLQVRGVIVMSERYPNIVANNR